MKKQILLAFAVLAAFTVEAGNLNVTYGGGGSDKKMTIGVSIGAGIPMGAWSKKNSDTAASVQNDSTHIQNGFAKTGFHFDVTAGYLFGSSFGAMVYIGGNMNSFDATTYATVNDIKSPETVSSKSYYVGQYLVGPYGAFGSGKLKINARVLVGLVTVNRPTMTFTQPFLGQTETYQRSGKGSSSFGYQIGAGIVYGINDNMGLTINLAYTGTTANYTGYTETESGPMSGTNTNTTLKQSMSLGLLTATVGLAFNL